MENYSLVTGAFGYTGKCIAKQLIEKGEKVKTLISHPTLQNPFGENILWELIDFQRSDNLCKFLDGVTTLYNTYWIRFPYKGLTFEQAIKNTRTLIRCAEKAGVKRIIHLSVTCASNDSSLPYFRGKGIIEDIIKNSKLSYSIIRPTLIFGLDDILINNISWLLKNFPLFFIPTFKDYFIQPVYIEDVAKICIESSKREDNIVIDVAGKEKYTFKEIVLILKKELKSKSIIMNVNPCIALFGLRLINKIVKDIILTRDELDGLMQNLLISNEPPLGTTSFKLWIEENATLLGKQYHSELSKHYSHFKNH